MGDSQLSAHRPKLMGTIRVEEFGGVSASELLYRHHGVLGSYGWYRVYLEHARVQVTNDECLSAVVNADHFDPFAVDVISGDDIPPGLGWSIIRSRDMSHLPRTRARAHVTGRVLRFVNQAMCER